MNTDPTATGVGRALTTLVELLEEASALEEDLSGWLELLELLLDTESLETGFEDVATFDEVDEVFVDDEDEVFLVEEVTGVDFVVVVTKAGVAVTALQT